MIVHHVENILRVTVVTDIATIEEVIVALIVLVKTIRKFYIILIIKSIVAFKPGSVTIVSVTGRSRGFTALEP